jgi:quercetin dioxygenase-like cupin family protein
VPPGIVHGFRNDTDAELRFVNLHAPGPRFIEYMRARRDGRDYSFDQFDPPEDGGLPTSGAVVGNVEFTADRPSLHVQLLTDVEPLGISESRAEPGGPSPPQHVHRRHVESFYVLEGEMTFTVAGCELRATAGTWVQVPPGTPHTFALTGSDDVRFLNLHTPSCGYGAFLRGLHEARSDEDLAAVRAAFDQEPA